MARGSALKLKRSPGRSPGGSEAGLGTKIRSPSIATLPGPIFQKKKYFLKIFFIKIQTLLSLLRFVFLKKNFYFFYFLFSKKKIFFNNQISLKFAQMRH